jgi:Flp pilus assembly protein CpaB
MSQRAFAILLIAFAISATVYRLALTPINLAPDNQTSEVVIAAHKLEIGTLVKDTDLRGGQWLGPLPRGIVLKKEDVVGRGVIAVINEGEPIFEKRLAALSLSMALPASDSRPRSKWSPAPHLSRWSPKASHCTRRALPYAT